ncbi:UNVERIFIED_CONTAM: hypothetical protein Sindi_0957600 [Sesamum indicum]
MDGDGDGDGGGGAASPAEVGEGTAEDGEPSGGGQTSGDGLEAGKSRIRREAVEESGIEKSTENNIFSATGEESKVVEMTGTVLVEKDRRLAMEIGARVQPPKLWFREDETTGSRNTMVTGLFPATEGRSDILEMRGTILNKKGRNLEDLMLESSENRAPPYLGFVEDEPTRTEKPMKEGSYSTQDCYNNVVGMGGVIPMAKDASLVSIQGNPKLGFGASKDANGGRSAIYSPAAFNLDEFLGLANKVLDGDESARAALLDLKNRWENKFGRSYWKRTWAAPATAGLLKPRRHLLPAKGMDTDGEKTGESVSLGAAMENDAVSSSSSEQLRIPAISHQVPTTDDRLPAGTVSAQRNSADLCADTDTDVEDDADNDISNDAGDDTGNDAGDDTGNDADAFNNSSRRTLSYIPPTIQNGEMVFKTVAFMEEAIEGGPWLFQGQQIVLQKWEPGMAMRKLKHTQVPVWTVASGIGKPLYPDAITRACTRLDFARVCVMLDISSSPPKHIIIMTPDEEGGETPCKIDVEYEWIPPKCTNCMTLGHSAKDCALNKPSKPTKPPVAVYIPKLGPPRPPTERDQEIIPPNQGVAKKRDRQESPRGDVRLSREEKAMWNVRGLNKRDHQLAVKDIVAEFRLQFLGLIQTCVRIHNVTAIQSFILPHWKWFVDYGSVGNRVWIAWDENFIEVEESVAITVIYGATEVADRRELWSSLENTAVQSVDVPWLIGGDFNAVRGLSEICGASGDIRMAMEEFNGCIQNAGLLPLPMEGEWYTWHNCSANHSPLVLKGDNQQQYGGMFRFDNYLTLSLQFISSVQQIWQHHIIRVPMYAVTRKLKALKSVFREQRRKKGDLSHNVQLAKGFLEMVQLLVSSNRQEELFLQLEHYCRIVLAKAAKLEQIMLQQRAKMQWMKGGDQCSRVFFRKISQKRSARRIFFG